MSNAEDSLATLIRPRVGKGWAKGLQLRDGNPVWKGDAAGYAALHKRVEKERGRERACSKCGTSDPFKTYEWANLTGRYTDVWDYARLCRSCHRIYDHGRKPSAAKLVVDCAQCTQPFQTWRSHVARGRRFCSWECARAARR